MSELAVIGQQSNKLFPKHTIEVWEAENCFGDKAFAKLVTYDNKRWIWAMKDSQTRRDWIGFDDWEGVKKRLEEFHFGRRKKNNK
jgi:hypothetical protein